MPESIALAQLKGLLADGVQLLDVPAPEEHAGEHLPGAANVPLKQLDAGGATTGDAPGVGHDACAGRSAMPSPGRSVVVEDQSRIPGFPWCDRRSEGAGLAVSPTRPRDVAKGPPPPAMALVEPTAFVLEYAVRPGVRTARRTEH